MKTSRLPALILAAFAAACSKTDKAATAHPEVTAAISEVRVEPYTEYVGAIGNVVGRPDGTARLSSPMLSRISSVMVVPGQAVARNAVLVILEQNSFSAATRSAEAAL